MIAVRNKSSYIVYFCKNTEIFVVCKKNTLLRANSQKAKFEAMDDPFVSCPYEPNHRVPRSRIQGHIVKCQKNYPELKICPFNATHRLPQSQIKDHVKNCPTRLEMFPEELPPKAAGALTKPKPILQKEYLPETDPNHEIWDN